MISCDTNDLAQQARCFQCINEKSLREIKTYLLCQWANSGSSPTPPDAPVSTGGIDVTGTSFAATWNASAGATSYELDVSTSNVFASFVPGYQDLNVGNVTVFLVTGLSNSVTYYYRVRAVNAGGTSANSNTSSVTTLSPPATPTLLDIGITSVNGGTILTWSNSDVPTSNEVWRSKNGAAYTLRASVGGNIHTYTETDVLPSGDYWSYKVRATNAGGSSAFSNLADAANDFSPTPDASVIISYPTLVVCYGFCAFGAFPNATTLDLPLLKKVAGGFTVNNPAALASMNVPSLVTVGADLDLTGNAFLEPISLPVLASVGGNFIADGCIAVSSINTDALTSTGANYNAVGCDSLVAIHASLLASVGGNLDIGSCPLLTSVNFPALTTLGAEFDFDNNTLLSTIGFANLAAFANGVLIFCQNSALDGPTINKILALGVASAVTTCDFELSGGTNAAPSGQGVLDKATLIGNGNTVNTN